MTRLAPALATFAQDRLERAWRYLLEGPAQPASPAATARELGPPRVLLPGERATVLDEYGRLRVSPGVAAGLGATVGSLPAETGAVLGLTGDVINRYFFDERASRTRATYAPDIDFVNAERRAMLTSGTLLCGFAHSHPRDFWCPSEPDREYAERLLQKVRVQELVIPIVQPASGSGAPVLHWFYARVNDQGYAEVHRVEADIVTAPLPGQFARVAGAYDVEWLKRCRVIAVGCGGAREAIEDLARIGVEQFVLIDPQDVAPENLGTQSVQRNEIGRPKVLACSDAIARINPDAAIVTIQRRIQEIPPRQLAVLLTGGWLGLGAPAASLVGAWSDSPSANAYAHRAGLNAGLPVVQAVLHRAAASGEIALAFPGRTRGCVRCATESRYAHYLQSGANDATSAGAPLWATTRLNALKLCVVVAALHAADAGEPDTVSPERAAQTRLLEQIAQRPLALLRLAPDASVVSGLRTHEAVFAGASRPDRILFDETVWREVEPRPGCADCGGTGDLRAAIARIDDFDAIPDRRTAA